MNPEFRRTLRIQELTKMALAGKTMEQIEHRAFQFASPPVARGYIAEVVRRVQVKQSKD